MLLPTIKYLFIGVSVLILCLLTLGAVSIVHASTNRNPGDPLGESTTSGGYTAQSIDSRSSSENGLSANQFNATVDVNFNTLDMSDLYLGTMSYSVPIKMPKGRNGIEPNIRLRYHSNKGNSWVGIGWDLNLGSIQLNPKRGVDYTSPGYLLVTDDGGSELIFTGGSTGDQYKAKIESNFYRIRKIAGSDGFPYWEVTDKKGIRYIYGKSDSCRQYDVADSSKNKIFKWCLERIEDTDGNYLTVTYVKDAGEVYLAQIDYTKHSSGLMSTYSIIFNLDNDRPDKVESYLSNFLIITSKRLGSIEVKANGKTINKYILSYVQDAGSNVSLLRSMTVFGSDNVTYMPATTFDYTGTDFNFITSSFQPSPAYGNGEITRYISSDVNGDGKSDVVYVAPNANIYVAISNNNLYEPFSLWKSGFGGGAPSNYRLVDVNGDGKADIVHINRDGEFLVALSDGTAAFGTTATVPRWVSMPFLAGTQPNRFFAGDFNADGKADFLYLGNAGFDAGGADIAFADLALSVSGTTVAFSSRTNVMPEKWGPSSPFYYLFGDYNGNGRTDMVFANNMPQTWGELYGAVSTGSGFELLPYTAYPGLITYLGDSYSAFYRVGDYNGDGKKDLLWISTAATLHVGTSTGTKFVGLNGATSSSRGVGADGSWYYNLSNSQWGSMGNASTLDSHSRYLTADVNGDGKTDVVYVESDGGLWVALSRGQSFSSPDRWGSLGDGDSLRYRAADVNGDGKADILYINASGVISVTISGGDTPHLLKTIDNGQGGTIGISYLPSTDYQNTQLPFVIPTVESITFYGGSGPGTESKYEYTRSGGYYNFGDREFRGFRQVTVSGPIGNNGEQAVQNIWFHQGNDTGIDDNDPGAIDGYMKGKPAKIQIEDGSGNLYIKNEIVYRDNQSPVSPSYFNPPQYVTNYQCNGTTTCKKSQVIYDYDIYGNLNYEEHITDIDDSTHRYDRTIVRTFSQQESNWLVGLPISEVVTTSTTPVKQIAKSEYFYDGTSCADTSYLIIPTKGKLTAIKYWLENKENPSVDISPEIRMAYDQYGNLACTKDARENTTLYTFDTHYKLFVTAVNYPIAGFPAPQFKYYGVDTDDANGQFGQIYQAIDSSGNATTFTYDVFGRKRSETLADGLTTSWQYTDSGGVGTQNVYTWNSAGIWSYSYFDGLKRPYYTRKSGPESGNIAIRTIYDRRGRISRQTVPYFEANGEDKSTTYAYDPIGRVTQVNNPDSTTIQSCYSNWTSVAIDENKHRKRYVYNALGKLAEVNEYAGDYPACTTDAGTPYAVTKYDYDVLGNLITVTNAKQHVTTVSYDTLSRKISHIDPDMGTWSYTYWPNGLLKSRKDAHGDQITFDYDNLNRLTFKKYSKDSSYVELNYDDNTVENGWGRLASLTNRDKSIIDRYFYDPIGRVKVLSKTINGVNYQVSYDYTDGKLESITYPNNEKVKYDYNADLLARVWDPATGYTYANFTGYNALLQIGNIEYGNGVNTAYQYYPDNNRLLSMVTSGSRLPEGLSYNYDYFDNGNVKRIDSSPEYIPVNLETISYTLSSGKAHQIDSITVSGQIPVTYDDNGNMTSVGQLQMTYDEDNLITSANDNSVRFGYDGAGKRVVKQANGSTRIYVENLYECLNGSSCGMYVFAGNQRIALKRGSDIVYYHKDHLGSTTMVSDINGNKIEYANYQPFGETESDAANPYTHKYTGQEQDAETDLYYYNARYYYPYLGRFVSPDTIVPNLADPQTLNRYSYVLNNPLRYTDPTGHEATSDGGFCSDDGGWGEQIASWGGGGFDAGFSSGNSSQYSGADAMINLTNITSPPQMDSPNFTNENGVFGFTGSFAGLMNMIGNGVSGVASAISSWGSMTTTYDSDAGAPSYLSVLNSPSASSNANGAALPQNSWAPSGGMAQTAVGLGGSAIGFGLSLADANPRSLVTGIAAWSGAFVFGFAPSQKVSDYGGLAVSAADTSLGLAAAGAVVLNTARSAIATGGITPYSLMISSFGVGYSLGTIFNHSVVYRGMTGEQLVHNLLFKD